MRIGSLFSGYGGLDIACQQFFGGAIYWYSEIEPAACKILTAHNPGVPNLGDITEVNWAEVEPVDILTGGYPCQPFSHAGKREGKNDERHLWPFVAVAIDALRPRVVVLENVRGHLTLGFGDVIADLSRMGYDAKWGVVRASDAGAPHGRARVFIVAYPYGERLQGHLNRPSEASTGGRGHVEPSDSFSADSDAIGRSRTGHSWEGRARFENSDFVISNSNSNRHGQQLHTGGMGSMETEAEGSAQQREWSRGESDSGSVIDWGKYSAAIVRWERVLGRSAPEPTIPGVNGRPRLSPKFVEWMMGLEPGHVTNHGLRPAQELKALGNGVCPQQALLALTLLIGE